MFDLEEQPNIIDLIRMADNAVIPLLHPWEHYDLGLNNQEIELFKNITINAPLRCIDCLHFRYYNFADLENLHNEIRHEIESYAIDDENSLISNDIASIITRLINNIIAASNYNQAFIALKAHKAVENFQDEYTWHMDANLKQRMDIAKPRTQGQSISNNHLEVAKMQIGLKENSNIFEHNYIASLLGPSTIFYSPIENRFDQAQQAQGTVYASDSEYGAIHSAPNINNIRTGRIILVVTPAPMNDILELKKLF